MNDAPILEHDPAPAAVIEPSAWFPPANVATRAVITWMPDVVETAVAEHGGFEVHRFTVESADFPVWEIDWEGRRLAVALAGVGAPMATLIFEMLVALGCRIFVACGSAGGLVPECVPGTVVVPDGSIRDEGVSYHYAPAARIARHPAGIQHQVRAACEEAGLDVRTGLTWTTDALFRETPALVSSRVSEGCLAVEMEAAALATVAAYRGVRLGYALYVADTLHGDEWDATRLVTPDAVFRRRLFAAAVAACLSVPD